MSMHRRASPLDAKRMRHVAATVLVSKNSDARMAKAPMTTWPANMLQKSRTASVMSRRNVENSSMTHTRMLMGNATPSGARLLM